MPFEIKQVNRKHVVVKCQGGMDCPAYLGAKRMGPCSGIHYFFIRHARHPVSLYIEDMFLFVSVHRLPSDQPAWDVVRDAVRHLYPRAFCLAMQKYMLERLGGDR